MTAAISISMPTANMDLSMAQDQVVFWLHDEESTVTAQKIQQECVYEQTDGSESGLTRFQGSSLLKQLYETDPSKYVATVVRIQQDNIDNVNENETIPITTFSCESNSNLDSDSDSTILALSKKTSGSQIASESLESSHETDMAALRDRLFSDNKDPSWFYNHSQLSTIQMAPSLGQDENIMPATPEEKTWHKLEKNGPIVRTSVNTNTSKTTKTTKALNNSSNTTTTGAKPKPVKPTTAKSFFSKKPAAASKPAPLKSTKPSDSKTSTKPSSAFTKRVRPEPKDQEESKKQEEKTDAAAAKAAASVGNADDFVGDEDEDSEDEQEMEERREKSKEIVRKQKQQDDMLDALQQQEDLDLQEEKPVLVKGAMDAFATKQTKPKPSSNNATTNAAAGKKRRKVLKEKTTVNAQGFLVTTTEAVWEDVSSDEEDTTTATTKPTKPVATKSSTRPASKLPAKKANPKAKKPSDMKQGSLMGFFAVKKK